MLTSEQAAQMIGLTKSTLAQWRHHGIGPDYIRISGVSIRYAESAVKEWLEQRRVAVSENDEEAARAVVREKKAAWRAARKAGAAQLVGSVAR
jgi:predicted DNA-binding transcriptional regulator AlpA